MDTADVMAPLARIEPDPLPGGLAINAATELNELCGVSSWVRRTGVNDTGAADSAERDSDPDSGVILAVAKAF